MSEKMKCCLTGATGHVGFALLKELSANGEDVRIILRKDPGYFDGIPCEKVKGDVTEFDSLVSAFKGCDIVYHLAGCVEIKAGYEDMIYNINVNGTMNVVKACIAAGVRRLVYMSSVDTYIPLPDNAVMHETKEYSPDTLEGTYAKTKALATRFVLDKNQTGELEVVVIQPSACIGPYDFKVSSIGSMVRMFLKGSFPVTMTFGGYNFVDVRDVARGTYAAALKGRPGECYILCGKVCTVADFISLTAQAVGAKQPKIKLNKAICDIAAPLCEVYYKAANKTPLFTRYSIRKLCANCNFSYEKAEKELGYSPMPLAESLKDWVKWIREN